MEWNGLAGRKYYTNGPFLVRYGVSRTPWKSSTSLRESGWETYHQAVDASGHHNKESTSRYAQRFLKLGRDFNRFVVHHGRQ